MPNLRAVGLVQWFLQGLSLRHLFAVMAEPSAAESCCCVAKQAHLNHHLPGELPWQIVKFDKIS